MPTNNLAELLEVANQKGLAEVGGSHNQKGIEFQRHWSVLRMFELAESGAEDFLLLFEAIQDVSVLDSSTDPTSICVYQVKKKDRKEWSWADLTSLHKPGKKGTTVKPLSDIQSSPIGKLYATINAFKHLTSTGRFVSNAGCDISLADGTSAATSLPSALSTLSQPHLDLLTSGLETLHSAGEAVPDLSRIHLERTVLSVDDPGTYLVGAAHKLLEARSPAHAGQARALVDALIVKIGPLGARTDHCKTFDQMKGQHGFSKIDFDNALGSLESLPDVISHLETWLIQLSQEGFGFIDVMAIRVAAAAIYRGQVMGSPSNEEVKLTEAIDTWLETKAAPTEIKTFFDEGYALFHDGFPNMRKAELLAHIALRAITKCVDQI